MVRFKDRSSEHDMYGTFDYWYRLMSLNDFWYNLYVVSMRLDQFWCFSISFDEPGYTFDCARSSTDINNLSQILKTFIFQSSACSKYFILVLVHMSTNKFTSEIYWPLLVVMLLNIANAYIIM